MVFAKKVIYGVFVLACGLWVACGCTENANEIVADEPADVTADSACVELRKTKNDFVPIESVLPCVRENEKVAFVIRHGERNPSESGYGDTLNADGAEQVRGLGRKLKDYPDFYYMHTDYYRTMETGYRIAQGKGQNVEEFTWDNCDSAVHEWNDDLRYYWFLKDGAYVSSCDSNGSKAAYTRMAYEPDNEYCSQAFYNAKERTLEFVKRNFTYGKMRKTTFAITHEYFVVPMEIAVTDGEIGMDYHNHFDDEYYWPNFLSGVAIIVDEKDGLTMIPVKGLPSGRMAER